MRLDSVRELKQLLPAHLNKTFAVRAAAGKTANLAVARAASLASGAPSYFLGVSKKGKKNYRLAVRLQDRALQKSELVDRIAARARGEIDVRYVGRIRARAKPWYQSRQRPLLIGSVDPPVLSRDLARDAGRCAREPVKQAGPCRTVDHR